MIEKIKEKYRQKFYQELAIHTGCHPGSIATNWFGRKYLGVPKNRIDEVEKFIDKFMEWQKESLELEKKLEIKHFGKHE